MKVRLGFVSNSSSASFLIATKEEMTYSQLRKSITDYFRKNKYNFYLPISKEYTVFNLKYSSLYRDMFDTDKDLHIIPASSEQFASVYLKKSPKLVIESAIEILTKINWESVSEITDLELNPISYRETQSDKKRDSSHILEVPFLKELKKMGYKYFYPGKGIPKDERWLFGLRIVNNKLALFVAKAY